MTHLVSALRWYMLDQLGLVGLGMYSALGVVEVGVGPYPPITNRHSFLLLVIDKKNKLKNFFFFFVFNFATHDSTAPRLL